MSLLDRDPIRPLARRFTRDRTNGKVLGVCAGVAEYFDIDVMAVRIAWALAIVFGVGAPILVYLVLALIMD
jgi:phage shock protein C